MDMPQWPVPGMRTSPPRAGAPAAALFQFQYRYAVGDDPRGAANRALLRSLLPAEPSWLKQVHGTRVAQVGEAGDDRGGPVEADASVTRAPGVVLAIQSADCMPVLLADRQGRVIAAAHAGWRGLCDGVIENAVRSMDVPGSIVAWLGPAIGPDPTRWGGRVPRLCGPGRRCRGAFVARLAPGKYLMDLYALARQRLARLGVADVHGGGWCTLRESERFLLSPRCDGAHGHAAVAGA
jgi:hypothetical protein